jgi:N-acetylmuramoyl-L-alanine amidase
VRCLATSACKALILVLPVLLAACSSPESRRTGWTPVPADADDEPMSGAPRGETPVSVMEARPWSAPASSPDHSARWLVLRDWSQARWGTIPRRLVSGNEVVWELRTPGGVLHLVPGSRRATWDGLTVWLGHAPFESNGECVVHEVDVNKNLLPLASGRPAHRTALGTVVIDPGHGGQNTGTRSIDPLLLEKDLTLDWALRLESLLLARGFRVVLTRRTDQDLSLSERVEVADRHKGDLFLSLHFNSAHPLTEHAGLETFCLTPVGLPSTLTRGYDDDVTLNHPNNRHDHDNLHFAFRIHRSLLKTSDATDRGIRRARFMGVLRAQDRPAVLIEAGYLSNPEEARRIATPAYRQQLAQAVADALTEFPASGPHPAQPDSMPAVP